jgi:Holliday junction resolvase RusA-like endonuclease
VSVQGSPSSRTAWQQSVALAARAKCQVPLVGDNLSIKITFFYNTLPDFDTDNFSKPICDALNNVVYADDHQLAQRTAGRRDINGSYRIRGVEPELALAIAEGHDFVYVEIGEMSADPGLL